MVPDGLPRSDAAEYEVRAWLFDPERLCLEALTCPDLASTITTRVSLREDRGRRRRRTVSAEQTARWDRASALIDQHNRAAWAGADMLREIAELRRALYYAFIGQEPPAIPGVGGGE